MITGWKEITRHTGFSRNTIKRLMKEEKFPLQYIASKPVTTQQAIQKWFERRTESTQSTE
jgi:predicted DNA-binding transcriptional regulator AlpA